MIEVSGCGNGRSGRPKGDVKGSVVGGYGACSRGSDDGGFGLLEQPLDRFSIGFMAELAGKLEDACSAEGGHAYSAPSAVDLGVPVFGGCSFRRRLFGWIRGGVGIGDLTGLLFVDGGGGGGFF